MPTPAELADWDQRHFWHAFTQMAEYEPLIIERASGCELVDVHGKVYLDAVSSMWCVVHGHRHPAIVAAIESQLQRLDHCTSLGMANPPAIELARRLAEVAPGDLDRVFFGSDGSSAIEVALKMAFQYWRQCTPSRPQKTRYLALGDAYHGDTLGSASVGGIERFHAVFEPLLFDVIRIEAPDPRKLPADVAPEAATGYFLSQVEQLLRDHHQELAAVVIEPIVQCAAGMVMHPLGFLRGLRELTRMFDVLLIADEVATGFGRTGAMFACQLEDVQPDFLCLGKGIAGGFLPLSATITHDEIYRAFLGKFAEQKTLFHGHTFGGNPLATAAALASLDLFDSENTMARLPHIAARLGTRLQLLAENQHVAHVRQRGLFGAFDLVPDRDSATRYGWDERRGQRVCQTALRHGIWLRPLGDVIYVAPPLSITIEQLDQIMDAIEAGIDEACQ